MPHSPPPPFMDWLNALHPSIKFTGSSNNSEINFLVTVIYKNESNRTGFRVFRKPSDRNALLHFRSHHPRRLINSLTYGQFLRLKRNSSKPTDYIQEKEILSTQLYQKCYPAHVINRAMLQAEHKNRCDLL